MITYYGDIIYCIADYLHGMQLSRMSSVYHELAIITDASFVVLYLMNDSWGIYAQALNDLNACTDGRN